MRLFFTYRSPDENDFDEKKKMIWTNDFIFFVFFELVVILFWRLVLVVIVFGRAVSSFFLPLVVLVCDKKGKKTFVCDKKGYKLHTEALT